MSHAARDTRPSPSPPPAGESPQDGHTATGRLGRAAALPVTAAQRILPAAGGLPLYAGLATLGLIGILEWPVAAGIGIGYAVLRRGALRPTPRSTPHPDTARP